MKDVVDILKDIIKINSMNPPGNEENMVQYIDDLFKGYKNKRIIEHKENRKSIIIEINGESSECISFVGHIDTVSANFEDGWKYNPLDPIEDEGYIYGRGTSDMKSGVACMLYLANEYINKSPKKNLQFVFTADEEQGGLGVKEIFKEKIFNNVDFFVIPEPTNLKLGIKEKSALWLKFSINGKSSHGAFPELGINAIDINYELMSGLKKELKKLEGYDDLLKFDTLSNNKIIGGVQTNIVANYCESYVDIRLIPKTGNERFLKIIDSTIEIIEEKYGEPTKIEYEILNNREAIETDLNDKYVKSFIENAGESGIELNYLGLNYYTDASDIIPYFNRPFIIFGPGDENLCHQVNEKVKVDNIYKALEIYRNFINN